MSAQHLDSKYGISYIICHNFHITDIQILPKPLKTNNNWESDHMAHGLLYRRRGMITMTTKELQTLNELLTKYERWMHEQGYEKVARDTKKYNETNIVPDLEVLKMEVK